MDSATLNTAITNYVNPSNPLDSHLNTTWRCNNSPTGKTSTLLSGGAYKQPNFCDLAGLWIDPDTGNWHGLIHNEFTGQPFGDSSHYDSIDTATSKDGGKTWTIDGHAITSPYSTTRNNVTAFPQSTYYYGDGDPRLTVDTASGYFYVFYGSRIIDKNGGWRAFHSHVARAPISGKLASSTWSKWYNGQWTEPGVGGKESNLVPTSVSSTGYTPANKEWSPRNTGYTAAQITAGTCPPTSALFVMDVTWNAYLGLWIGEPQNPDQSGNAPQEFYSTADLTTQKWTKLVDTGSYHTASWYRWLLDPVTKTSSQIVGKSFRAYCSFGCSNGASGEYINLSIDTSSPAAPVDTSRAWYLRTPDRILGMREGYAANWNNSMVGKTAVWTFTPVGDGAYTIINGAKELLTTTGRQWGATIQGVVNAGTPTPQQQWWVVPVRSATNNAASGGIRLINRYSGLALALPSNAAQGANAETTPQRFWNDASGTSVGGGRRAADQVFTLS
jgi:hypothetical protein